LREREAPDHAGRRARRRRTASLRRLSRRLPRDRAARPLGRRGDRGAREQAADLLGRRGARRGARPAAETDAVAVQERQVSRVRALPHALGRSVAHARRGVVRQADTRASRAPRAAARRGALLDPLSEAFCVTALAARADDSAPRAMATCERRTRKVKVPPGLTTGRLWI